MWGDKVAFAVDGGIEWEKWPTPSKITIRPADNPESGYQKGQMKDYSSVGPWSPGSTKYTLVIEDGVLNIGSHAFNGCRGLNGNLTIPNSVTTIGSYAFTSCSSFTGALTIPDSVTYIGEYAFDIGQGFTSLKLSNKLTSIESNSFKQCSGLTGTLTIPDSVTHIGDNAFNDCFSLTGLIVSKNVTNIGSYAFDHCLEVSSITFRGNEPNLGDHSVSLGDYRKLATCDCYSPHNWAKSAVPSKSEYTNWTFYDSTQNFLKVSGAWKKEAATYCKVNGSWKEGTKYIKSGGQWK